MCTKKEQQQLSRPKSKKVVWKRNKTDRNQLLLIYFGCCVFHSIPCRCRNRGTLYRLHMCVQCTIFRVGPNGMQAVCVLYVLSVHCTKSPKTERNPSLVERKTFNRKMKPYLLRTQREIQNMQTKNCDGKKEKRSEEEEAEKIYGRQEQIMALFIYV